MDHFLPKRTDIWFLLFCSFYISVIYCSTFQILFHFDFFCRSFGIKNNEPDVIADLLHALASLLATVHLRFIILFPNVFLYLDHSHVQAGLLRQLLPDVSGGFRSGRERRLQCFQLLGLDGCPGPASLSHGALLVVFVAARFFVGQMSRFRVFAVVLRVLGIRRHARVAAGGDCQEGKDGCWTFKIIRAFMGAQQNLKSIYNYI